MENFRDLVFRYCIMFGRRFSYKDKIAFLRIIAKELMGLGYSVDAKIAKLKLAKKRYENYYNAYIGDLNKAELIICTHYDTGINNFNLLKTYAFKPQFSKLSYFIGLSPIIILFMLSVIVNYFIFIPNIALQGFLSFSGVASILTTVVLFFFILKFRNGIANKKNFVCNSSSIITIINLIKKLDKRSKKKIAFVLYDGGNSNQYGLKMLENYSNNVSKKKIIFLDSIGNSEELLFFKPASANFEVENVNFHQGNMPINLKNYMMATAGVLNENNEVAINNAHSRKDDHLSSFIIEQHTETLHRICQQLLSKNSNE
ncbi:hypothetical protein RHO12_08510 [Orbus sturtevantii]|uniref:hypothetical protein n=1 Tax=Orbus sturtevantii TaxID=3074109 RepID=UPI00370D26F7